MVSRSTSCSSEASASGGKDPLVPAQAGTQGPHNERPCKSPWIPACAGMSGESAVQFEEDMLLLSQDRVMTRAMNEKRRSPMITASAVLRPLGGCACALACTLLFLATPQGARAQAFPSKTIMAVIPFAPGNANDVVARIVLDQLQKQLGQPIVIENRAGAGGTTGVAFVAKAAPDGYTVLVHSSTFSASYSLYKTLPYDTFNDFAAVVPFGVQPTVLVATPAKGWKTVADLVAAAKASPGKLNYASAGVGAASHLAAERI